MGRHWRTRPLVFSLPPHLQGNFAERESITMKVLNLVTLVLAQVCVTHVQFHLAVELRRLPHLSFLTASSGALQS